MNTDYSLGGLRRIAAAHLDRAAGYCAQIRPEGPLGTSYDSIALSKAREQILLAANAISRSHANSPSRQVLVSATNGRHEARLAALLSRQLMIAHLRRLLIKPQYLGLSTEESVAKALASRESTASRHGSTASALRPFDGSTTNENNSSYTNAESTFSVDHTIDSAGNWVYRSSSVQN